MPNGRTLDPRGCLGKEGEPGGIFRSLLVSRRVRAPGSEAGRAPRPPPRSWHCRPPVNRGQVRSGSRPGPRGARGRRKRNVYLLNGFELSPEQGCLRDPCGFLLQGRQKMSPAEGADTHKYRGSLKSSMCKYSIDPTRSRTYKYLSSQIRVSLPLLSMH